MAYSQSQLDSIEEARARGVLEAWLPDGSRIKYRTLADMDQIISEMRTELGINPTYTNVAHPKYKRGFE